MTDPAYLQAALERLQKSVTYYDGSPVEDERSPFVNFTSRDLRTLLTSHTALLARAEAAERMYTAAQSRAEGWKRSAEAAGVALKPFAEVARWPIGAMMITTRHVVHCDLVRTGYPATKEGSFGLKAADFVLALATYDAAHPQPQAPVMGGEGA